MSDPHNLERFVIAQDANGIYERAVAELRCGHKASHWMWFVFPQLAHPGQSPTSRTFAITSPQEATAYLQHPVLGPRAAAMCRPCRHDGGPHRGADLR